MGLFGSWKKTTEVHNEQENVPVSMVSNESGNEVTLDLSKGGLLNLNKNDFLNLSKTDFNLEHIRLSAGWDVNDSRDRDYDLDLCALLLNGNNKLVSNTKDIVYYGSKKAQGIELDHDNLTGEGEGDDENMFVSLNKVNAEVAKILVCVVIYQGESRGQHFKNVKNAYVRLVDESQRPEKEICRCGITEDGGKATAVEFAEIYRTESGWNFKALGNFSNSSIERIKDKYR